MTGAGGIQPGSRHIDELSRQCDLAIAGHRGASKRTPKTCVYFYARSGVGINLDQVREVYCHEESGNGGEWGYVEWIKMGVRACSCNDLHLRYNPVRHVAPAGSELDDKALVRGYIEGRGVSICFNRKVERCGMLNS